MKRFLIAFTICQLAFPAFADGYHVSLKDAEVEVSRAIVEKGIGEEIEAHISGRTSDYLLDYNEPVTMEIAHIDVDPSQQRFKAKLSFMTEAQLNKSSKALGTLDVSGRYDEIFSIPVVKYRIRQGDIIRSEDITWQKLPSMRLRQDTIRSDDALIGSTPIRGLSPGRPVRASEVKIPPIVTRQSLVQMQYKTPNLTIQALGTAMQDGALNEKIKVRNDDSGTLVDAVVVDKGKVRVLSPSAR